MLVIFLIKIISNSRNLCYNKQNEKRFIFMFDYTKVAIEKVVEDLKKLIRLFTVGMQVITLAYFALAIVLEVFEVCSIGNFYANIALFIISLAYLIFDLIISNGKREGSRLAKKITTRTLKWIKILIKGYTLGVTIYGIYTATTSATPIAVILATLMIIIFVLQVLFEILTAIVIDKKDLILDAWRQDIEDIKRPAVEVGNFFKRITGQEPIERTKPNGNIKMLDKRLAKKREAKRLAKERLKEERRANRRGAQIEDLSEVAVTEDNSKKTKK